MKENVWTMVFILLLVGLILFDKWLFESVMASDFPDWVKYIILS